MFGCVREWCYTRDWCYTKWYPQTKKMLKGKMMIKQLILVDGYKLMLVIMIISWFIMIIVGLFNINQLILVRGTETHTIHAVLWAISSQACT